LETPQVFQKSLQLPKKANSKWHGGTETGGRSLI